LNNIADHNAMSEDPQNPWSFDSLAKRTSLLFDKIYLTDNLDLTCEIVGGVRPFVMRNRTAER
jgi:hypothetical protein